MLGLWALCSTPLLAAEPMELSAEERRWLERHPVVRVAPDPDFPPIESIDGEGRLVGMSADYLELLEKKLGIRFRIDPVSSWDEAMAKARNRDVDMLSAATETSARSEFMSFTTPHIELPGVIIVRSDAGDYSSLDRLRGKRVGVVSGYVWQEWIVRDHPDIDLRPVRDVQTGLLLVSFGELDAMVGNLATATHTLKRLGITNLRVAGETGYFARLAIATRNDWPELNAIMRKAISSIGPERRQAILDRWIRLDTTTRLDGRTILLGILIIIAVIVAAAAASVLWNYSLRQRVRRQSESLRESEARFRAIVEDQTEYIARSLPGDRTLSFVNEAFCRCFGKSREELIGTSLMEYVRPDDRDRIERLLASLSTANPVIEVERETVVPNGETRWHRWTNRAIFDDRGNIVEIQGVGRDITESRRAEEALRESEQRYRLLIETSPDALLVTGMDKRIVFASATAVALFGAESADQLIGMNMLDLVHPDDRDDVIARYEQVLQGTLPPFVERRRLRLDGSDFLSESRDIPFVWDGDDAILIAIRDITERKQAEERLRQAQKMEAVGQLTAGVAHDFNNLLTVVLGNAEMIKSDHEGDADGKAADTMIRAVMRGAELTGRLLAFSRRQPLSPEPVDVGPLVAGMTDMLRRTLGETIEIETRDAGGLWPVEADPNQLENAILNLAINARDAMSGGGALILESANARLDADAVERIGVTAGDYVAISVADDGTGMSPEVRERVFEPFFTTKEVGKGSGLGLSMVYGFVAQSGGGVNIDSELGRGTKVTLYLPRASGLAQEASAGPAAEFPRARGESLLLVEDEPDVRAFTSAMLRDLGYDVHEAGDAREALSALEHISRLDMLVTDVVLPGGMSGPELVDEVRRCRAGVKALYLSGYPDRPARSKDTRDGVIELLPKPFSRSDLARVVRDILDGKTVKRPRVVGS